MSSEAVQATTTSPRSPPCSASAGPPCTGPWTARLSSPRFPPAPGPCPMSPSTTSCSPATADTSDGPGPPPQEHLVARNSPPEGCRLTISVPPGGHSSQTAGRSSPPPGELRDQTSCDGASPARRGRLPGCRGLAAVTPQPRYRQLARRYDPVVARAGTCACHAHVGVPSRDLGGQARGALPRRAAADIRTPGNNMNWRSIVKKAELHTNRVCMKPGIPHLPTPY